MPVAGLINAKLYGEADTIERMRILPTQIIDLKALTGDARIITSGYRESGQRPQRLCFQNMVY